jgi:hypothetical protein
VIHTGAEEVFTFQRLVGYGAETNSSYDFNEVVDELRPLTVEELDGLNESLLERMAHEDYILLLSGENTSRLAGRGLHALVTGLYMRCPVIVMNLNGCRHCEPSRLPAELENRLFLCISPEFPVLKYALDSWREESFRLISLEKNQATAYPSSLYEALLPHDLTSDSTSVAERIPL